MSGYKIFGCSKVSQYSTESWSSYHLYAPDFLPGHLPPLQFSVPVAPSGRFSPSSFRRKRESTAGRHPGPSRGDVAIHPRPTPCETVGALFRKYRWPGLYHPPSPYELGRSSVDPFVGIVGAVEYNLVYGRGNACGPSDTQGQALRAAWKAWRGRPFAPVRA